MDSEVKAEDELSLIDAGLNKIPDQVLRKAAILKKLDFSDNRLTSGENLDKLTVLDTLILDRNEISDIHLLPNLPSLTTLWLNNNKISDLHALLDHLSKACPNLGYLSMLRNPACPDLYCSGEIEAYQRYRYSVIHRLPKLSFLDSTPVTPEERKEAEIRGPFLRVAKPQPIVRKGTTTSQTSSPSTAEPAPAVSTPRDDGPPKVATFLARGRTRYDGSHSEGNRFIVNDDL